MAARTWHSVLPLLDFEGRPSGVVQLRGLTGMTSGEQQARLVRDLATPVSQCTLAAPGEQVTEVLSRLGTGGGLPVLAMDGGRLDGIVTAHDIERRYQRHQGTRAPEYGAGRQEITT